MKYLQKLVTSLLFLVSKSTQITPKIESLIQEPYAPKWDEGLRYFAKSKNNIKILLSLHKIYSLPKKEITGTFTSISNGSTTSSFTALDCRTDTNDCFVGCVNGSVFHLKIEEKTSSSLQINFFKDYSFWLAKNAPVRRIVMIGKSDEGTSSHYFLACYDEKKGIFRRNFEDTWEYMRIGYLNASKNEFFDIAEVPYSRYFIYSFKNSSYNILFDVTNMSPKSSYSTIADNGCNLAIMDGTSSPSLISSYENYRSSGKQREVYLENLAENENLGFASLTYSPVGLRAFRYSTFFISLSSEKFTLLEYSKDIINPISEIKHGSFQSGNIYHNDIFYDYEDTGGMLFVGRLSKESSDLYHGEILSVFMSMKLAMRIKLVIKNPNLTPSLVGIVTPALEMLIILRLLRDVNFWIIM